MTQCQWLNQGLLSLWHIHGAFAIYGNRKYGLVGVQYCSVFAQAHICDARFRPRMHSRSEWSFVAKVVLFVPNLPWYLTARAVGVGSSHIFGYAWTCQCEAGAKMRSCRAFLRITCSLFAILGVDTWLSRQASPHNR